MVWAVFPPTTLVVNGIEATATFNAFRITINPFCPEDSGKISTPNNSVFSVIVIKTADEAVKAVLAPAIAFGERGPTETFPPAAFACA
jgi:hypothetical protein